MKGDEERVVTAFCAWLERQGWTTIRSAAGVDVYATKDAGPALYAEAKGHTTEPGLDVDTMFGQLLRRMNDRNGRYAVVVPEGRPQRMVERVPAHIIDRLGIEVYAVADDGNVRQVVRGTEGSQA